MRCPIMYITDVGANSVPSGGKINTSEKLGGPYSLAALSICFAVGKTAGRPKASLKTDHIKNAAFSDVLYMEVRS